MQTYSDFHIHTALSPCGNYDMTPNNIVNMAKLKGLGVIGITDHNSCENVAACIEAGKREGIIVIPGMELQTREDVHVICLFDNLDSAYSLQNYVYNHLAPMKNNEGVLGEQFVYNSYDEIIRKNDRLLLTAADISFDKAYEIVMKLDGVFIPAHIDRDSYSIISSLGFLPDYLDIVNLEYCDFSKLKVFMKLGILKKRYNYIKSSDAHYLEEILESQFLINIDRLCPEEIISWLKNRRR